MIPAQPPLGIDVTAALRERWRGWCAPTSQPFALGRLPSAARSVVPRTSVEVADEWRDTFLLYGVGETTWLDEAAVRALPREVRRAVLAERRARMGTKPVPPWPSASELDARIARWIECGVRPSSHAVVSESTWSTASVSLPAARELAGTFPAGSGANCFATVVAAIEGGAGQDDWMQIDAFQGWLADRTIPVEDLDPDARARSRSGIDAGTVLVWHEGGEVAHAAVTIGDGWVLVKPSQSWSSPRVIWSMRSTIAGWTYPGTRLSRHVLR